jgi:tetratricopeptide (TPR) repeat protein
MPPRRPAPSRWPPATRTWPRGTRSCWDFTGPVVLTMNPSSPLNRPVLWLIAAAVLLGCGELWWLCCRDSSIPFLPAAGSAEWIVYPKPPDTTPRTAAPFWAVFRRSFHLAAAPAKAKLAVRAFKQGTVRINGRLVGGLLLGEQDCKTRHRSEVAALLKVGENEISVTVSNSLGPPALWLSLHWDTQALYSDPDWQVSLVGAAWQKAVLASEPPAIRPGNPLYGRETVISSLHRTWPQLLLVLLLSAAVVGGCNRILRSSSAAGPNDTSRAAGFDRLAIAPVAVLGVIVLSWIVLFSHNLPQLATLFGFDRDGHQQYIDYILRKKALPLAQEGWQMYQPPLFYLLSALIIGPFGWLSTADSAVLTLRSFSALTGLVHVALVLLCLRLLFPGQPRRQIVGLLLAAFLPMQVCLSHHITNESLAALFVTAALYFSLRLLRTEGRGIGLAIGVGACLGLALLTKFSAVLAIPFVLGALVWKEVQGLKSEVQGPASRGSWRRAGAQVSLVAAASLMVCGWHYVRVWRHFGTPLIGNWDPRLPFAWWQDPGCHTTAWYGRVGEALICPLFSSLTGFADGVYATLWGDGLCSGSAAMNFRPQWNYDLMNAGYLLSLLGAILLTAGMFAALVRFIRQPTPEWFLLLGLVFAFAAGIALMSLGVASYAQVKAFYALPALFPLCAVAVIGWDFIAEKGAVFRPVLRMGLLAWAITVYGAFWIRSGNAFTYTARGVGLADEKRYAEAADNFSRALQLDPDSLPARVGLAEAWRRLGRSEEAHQQAALALQQHPEEAEAHIETAVMLALDHHYPEAVQHVLQAIAKVPDNPGVYQQLAGCLARMDQHQQVIEACRQGLRVNPFNPTLHHTLGLAAANLGDLTNSVIHLRLALALKPNWPEARSLLALTLSSLGQTEEAATQYEQAIREKPDDAQLHYLYAMALALQGRAREAAGHYRQALTLKPDMVEALNNLAWILAANPTDSLRNGPEAVRLAERACALTQNTEPVFLGTLAAAYAEAGRLTDAVQTAEKARDLAAKAGLEDVAQKNAQLLELYRAGKPYREAGH